MLNQNWKPLDIFKNIKIKIEINGNYKAWKNNNVDRRSEAYL